MYSIPNLKYKTTLCHNWLEGTACQKGQNCYFAHGQLQLRKIQENQHVISSRNQVYLQYQPYNNYKTVYCKFYSKGQCKLGASCTFAHQKKQKRKMGRSNPNQQQPMMPFIQYNVPFFYPPFQTFGIPCYNNQNFGSFGGIPYNVENIIQFKQQDKKGQIQSKSQQKKRSRIEERSTNEKQNDDVQNEEESTENKVINQSFNLQ